MNHLNFTPTMHVFHQVEGMKRIHCSLFTDCLFSCPNHICHKCPLLEFFDVDIPQNEKGTWFLTNQVYNVIRQHTKSFPLVKLRFIHDISQSMLSRFPSTEEEIMDVQNLHDQQHVSVWVSACKGCKFIKSMHE